MFAADLAGNATMVCFTNAILIYCAKFVRTPWRVRQCPPVSASVRRDLPGSNLHYRGSGSCSSETSFLVWMNEFATDADGCAVCAPPQPRHRRCCVRRAPPGERVTPDLSLGTTEPNNSYSPPSRHFTKLYSSLLISISRFRLICRLQSGWWGSGVWPVTATRTAPLCCAPAPLRTAAASFVYKPPSWSRPQLSYWPLLRNLSVNICLYTFPPHQTQLQPPVNGKMAGTGYCSSGTHSRVCSELRCRKAATHCVPRAPRTHSIFHTGSTLLRIMHYMTDFPVTAPAGGRLFLAEMSASDLVQ